MKFKKILFNISVKNVTLLCCILFLMVTFGGCAASDASDKQLITYSRGYQSGFFYDENLYLKGLTRYNLVTGESSVICGVPGCLHNGPECLLNQYIFNDSFSAIYDTHALFFDSKSSSLYMINTDGTGIKKLIDFSEYDDVFVWDKLLIGNNFYLAVQLNHQSLDETGYVNTVSGAAKLYRINMLTGSVDILHESKSSLKSTIQRLLFTDNSIIFTYYLRTKKIEDSGLSQREYVEKFDEYYKRMDEIEGIEYYCIVYNLETDTYYNINTCSDNIQYEASCAINGNIYFNGDDGNIYIKSLDAEDSPFDLFTVPGVNHNSKVSITQSSDFALFKVYNKGAGYDYYMIKEGSDTLTCLSEDIDSDFELLDECYCQLKVQFFDASEAEGFSEFDEDKIKLISRDEFKSWFK